VERTTTRGRLRAILRRILRQPLWGRPYFQATGTIGLSRILTGKPVSPYCEVGPRRIDAPHDADPSSYGGKPAPIKLPVRIPATEILLRAINVRGDRNYSSIRTICDATRAKVRGGSYVGKR
jgi:hypothetical protein